MRRLILSTGLTAALALAVAPALAQKNDDPGASDTEIKIVQSMPNSGPAQPYVTMANVTQRPPTELAVGQFPPLAVRMEFNAHWGATSGGQADAAFSPDRAPVILVFLHRDPGADLYVFFVLHDPSAMDDLQVAAFHALRFAEPVGLGGTWLPD